MTKLSKESILPLASLLTGGPYTQEALKVLEEMKYREYDPTPRSRPSQLTKKQTKSRAKAKAARKARKRK